jgi:ferredoxin
MDENETAYVTDYEGESGDVIREAVDACPVECIHWEN